MIYTAIALVLVIAIAGVVLRGGTRDRERFLRGASAATAAGAAFVLVAVVTGNVAFFYGGAFLVTVGLPLLGVMTVAVYRDRQRFLDPTRFDDFQP